MNDNLDSSLQSQVLNNLLENAPGGFILFIINSEGSPEVFNFYDSDMSALALQNFALLWSQATRKSQSENMLDMMMHEPPPGEEMSEEE